MEFKFGSGAGASQRIRSSYTLRAHLSGSAQALPSSRLRYLNKAVSSQIYKKYDWQHQAGLRALLHALCHYTLRVKIMAL